MITEDYVSVEVAQLLKEKGFNEPIWTRYEDDNEVIFGDKYNWNNSPMGAHICTNSSNGNEVAERNAQY